MVTINPINSQNPIQVADGGLGVSTLTTAYAPVCAGTTATGPVQVASTGLGTSGFVLTSNGASAVPSFQSAAGNLILIQTQNASGTPATISFTSGITSQYTTYFMVYSNVIASTSVDTLAMQWSTNGGSGYITTGYGSSTISSLYSSATLLDTSSTTYCVVAYESSTTIPLNGSLWMYNLATAQVPICTGQYFGGASTRQGFNSGNNTTTSGVNAFKLYFVSGATFTTGTFSLYGLIQ